MTQEDKELLLKDLCARSPYKVMCQVSFDEEDVHIEPLESVRPFMSFNQITTSGSVVSIDCVKPYLRPMSSMTDEEREEYRKFSYYGAAGIRDKDFTEMVAVPSFEKMDYLNSHHFDYRRLIEKGLALKAPNGMYNIK